MVEVLDLLMTNSNSEYVPVAYQCVGNCFLDTNELVDYAKYEIVKNYGTVSKYSITMP